MTTMSQLISDTLTRLSMASGIGSQLYSEDRIALAINEAFITIFEDRFWRRYRVQQTFTLDGSTGVVTADLSDLIIQFEDIEHIWTPNHSLPLPVLPKNVDESQVRRLCFAPIATAKIFKILPATTTGTIRVSYRTRPTEDYADEDDVPMDRFLLMYRACYDILIDEGSNEQAVQKFLSQYNQRYERLVELEGKNAIDLDDYSVTQGVDQWQEYPY